MSSPTKRVPSSTCERRRVAKWTWSTACSAVSSREPLERTDRVARLYDQARAVARELGQELAEGGTGGGSDGNFTAALGVPTLDGLGAIGDGAHALHEHVDIHALADRAALVAGLIASVAGSSTL